MRQLVKECYKAARSILGVVSGKAISIWCIGNTFLCPICRGRFRKMKPFKGSYYIKGLLVDHYTRNAICPKCNSQIRHRFLFTFLTDYTNLFTKNMKLLHFAPEKWFCRIIKKQSNVEYVTCDLNPEGYPGSIKVDITNIHFADESFNAVICIHVLEHIENDLQSIKEIYRILKPNGWALIAVPVYGEKTIEIPELDFKSREKMYGIGEHVRMNGLDLVEKISNVGFSAKVYSVDDVSGAYIDRNVNSPKVESDKYLFFCEK